MGKTRSHRTVEDRSQELTSNIESLPGEVLPFIFAHLSAEDCRNVRLTCKLWYRYSFEPAVTKNQKFVFTEDETFEEIVRFLLESIGAVHQLNLEFHDLSMYDLPSSVWKQIGHRVHTLHFWKCELNFRFLADIFVHCANLTTLTMEQNQNYDYDDENAGVKNNSPTLLTDLIDKQGLIRPKLHTFICFHDDYYFHLSTITVKQIFALFPCLKYIGTGYRPSYDYQLPRVPEEEEAESVYSNFDECLDPSMQLERIVFNQTTDGSWMERSILMPEWSSRLIEFLTQLNLKKLPDFGRDLLFRFFAAQKNLEIVTLNEFSGDEIFTRELMFCILENCPKLRELQIRFEDDDLTGERLLLRSVTFQTCTEFARFFSLIAKLECFVVNFDIELDFPSESLSSLPPANFAMKRLHLDQSIMSELFCLTVLKRCSKLTYLKLAIIFDDILQEVFKNSDLQTLLLCTFLYHHLESELTDYGFTGESETRSEGSSIKNLQKLEHLRLVIYDSFQINRAGWQETDGIFKRRSGVTIKSIHELQFPLLKKLDLFLELESQLNIINTGNASPDPNNLPPSPGAWYCSLVKPTFELPEQTAITLVSNLPAIEKLIISPTPKNFETIFRMCQLSKNLSFLHCAQLDDFDVHRVFNVCPNLKNVLLYEDGDEERFHFHRHPRTNTIQYMVQKIRVLPVFLF